MLEQSGIKDATTQLEINIILTAWSFVIAVTSSYFADRIGRKLICCLSLGGGVMSLYLLGDVTAAYGTSANTRGIYATIATIFLYNGPTTSTSHLSPSSIHPKSSPTQFGQREWALYFATKVMWIVRHDGFLFCTRCNWLEDLYD